jgi:8-oxo-dGTP diphosphatase
MIHVVCLIIVDPDNFFLATQRPAEKSMGLHWEFPGGKVEPGESAEQALRREIEEELTLCVGKFEQLPDSVHQYYFGTICLTPFLYRCSERPEFVLTEHNDSCWVEPLKWEELMWAPADIQIVENFVNEVCVCG